MNSFSAVGALKASWATFQKRPWFLMFAVAVVLVISIISTAIAETIGEISMSADIIGIIGDAVVQLLAGLALLVLALKAHDHVEDLKLSHLWAPSAFWRYLGVTIVSTVVIALGFLLLIIPGIIFMTMFIFAPYYVVDRSSGPIEAMKQSFHATKGSRMQIFFLIILITLINLIGLLAFFIGLILTIPISLLAVAQAYRTLSAQSDTATPAAA